MDSYRGLYTWQEGPGARHVAECFRESSIHSWRQWSESHNQAFLSSFCGLSGSGWMLLRVQSWSPENGRKKEDSTLKCPLLLSSKLSPSRGSEGLSRAPDAQTQRSRVQFLPHGTSPGLWLGETQYTSCSLSVVPWQIVPFMCSLQSSCHFSTCLGGLSSQDTIKQNETKSQCRGKQAGWRMGTWKVSPARC